MKGDHALDWFLRRGLGSFGGFLIPWLELEMGYRTHGARGGERKGLTAKPREDAALALDDCALDDWRDHRAPREGNGRSLEKHGGNRWNGGGWSICGG